MKISFMNSIHCYKQTFTGFDNMRENSKHNLCVESISQNKICELWSYLKCSIADGAEITSKKTYPKQSMAGC